MISSTQPDPPEPSYDSLPDLLLRPVAEDSEMSHILREDLVERLNHAKPRKGELSSEDALTRLRSRLLPAGNAGKWLGRALAAAAVAVSLIAVALEAETYLALNDYTPWGQKLMAIPAVRDHYEGQVLRIPARREDNPLLLEREQYPGNAEEACWRGHPEDPVLYYRYIKSVNELPADYEETWKRIDPGNAYWKLLEANRGPLAIHLNWRLHPPDPARPSTPELGALIEEAGKLPRCHDYREESDRFMNAQWYDPATLAQAFKFTPPDSSSAQNAGIDADNWAYLSRIAFSGPPSAGDSAARLQAKRWLAGLEAEARSALADENSRIAAAGYTQRIEIDEDELASAGWIKDLRFYVAMGSAGFLLLAGLLHFRQWPAKSPAGRMAACARPLLSKGGAFWTIALGAVLPAALIAPLASALIRRDPVQSITAPICGLGAGIGLILFALACMVEMTRRQVSGGLALLGMRSTRFQRGFGWLLVLISLVPAVSCVIAMMTEDTAVRSCRAAIAAFYESPFAHFCEGAVALTLLWILIRAVLGYTSPAANVRHRVIASRLVPACLAASLAFGLAALGLHLVERDLVKRALHRPGFPRAFRIAEGGDGV